MTDEPPQTLQVTLSSLAELAVENAITKDVLNRKL